VKNIPLEDMKIPLLFPILLFDSGVEYNDFLLIYFFGVHKEFIRIFAQNKLI